MLASDRPRKPNPECPVCSSFQITLDVDFDRITLQDLVEKFVKEKLKLNDDGEFVISNEVGILYDIDETDNVDKKLSDLSVSHGTFLTVTDDSDEPFVNVVVNLQKAYVLSSSSSDNKKKFFARREHMANLLNYSKAPLKGEPFAIASSCERDLDGSVKVPKQPKKTPKPTPVVANSVSSSTQPLTVDDDDDLIIPEIQPTTNKRPLEDNANAPAAKRAKTAEAMPDGVVASAVDVDAVAANGPGDAAVVIDD